MNNYILILMLLLLAITIPQYKTQYTDDNNDEIDDEMLTCNDLFGSTSSIQERINSITDSCSLVPEQCDICVDTIEDYLFKVEECDETINALPDTAHIIAEFSPIIESLLSQCQIGSVFSGCPNEDKLDRLHSEATNLCSNEIIFCGINCDNKKIEFYDSLYDCYEVDSFPEPVNAAIGSVEQLCETIYSQRNCVSGVSTRSTLATNSCSLDTISECSSNCEISRAAATTLATASCPNSLDITTGLTAYCIPCTDDALELGRIAIDVCREQGSCTTVCSDAYQEFSRNITGCYIEEDRDYYVNIHYIDSVLNDWCNRFISTPPCILDFYNVFNDMATNYCLSKHCSTSCRDQTRFMIESINNCFIDALLPTSLQLIIGEWSEVCNHLLDSGGALLVFEINEILSKVQKHLQSYIRFISTKAKVDISRLSVVGLSDISQPEFNATQLEINIINGDMSETPVSTAIENLNNSNFEDISKIYLLSVEEVEINIDDINTSPSPTSTSLPTPSTSPRVLPTPSPISETVNEPSIDSYLNSPPTYNPISTEFEDNSSSSFRHNHSFFHFFNLNNVLLFIITLVLYILY
eukprot:TRINITY_DN13621_c0_g1_i1.p1 TRINITY_DN13621_c0_g1~~TRINITY_DN13621_c0_g1_i1.p1  ORF type:complete len:582 (+),score=106.78 TRINITY_DN13621_c0_g1_i1:199-1944(+)